jgi:DNA-directed RNA polymerase beta subunit
VDTDDAKFCGRIKRLSGNTPTERKCHLLAPTRPQRLHRRFDRLADAPVDENGNQQKKYDIIQADGLAGVGERVDPGDVYINKQTPTNANDNNFSGHASAVPYKNAPMTYKSPIAGNIDKVMITDTENDQTLIKVLIRQTRRPELGDKFSSRHGQKGVCGLIVNQEDMPFNDQGVVPGELHDQSSDVIVKFVGQIPS